MSKVEKNDFDAAFEKALAEAAPIGDGQNYPHIDIEGKWVVKVVEASYGPNQAGTAKRGLLKVEVVANLDGTPDRVTARTNLYINEGKSPELSVRNLAPWKHTLEALVGKAKLLEDVADYDDLIQAIIAHSNKLLKRGTDILVVLQTRKQAKLDDKGREQFYKNVYQYDPAVKEAPEAKEATGSFGGPNPPVLTEHIDPFEADPF